MRKTYLELSNLKSFEERLNYLMLYGQVGVDTFGFDRYLNQMLYHDYDWKQVRKRVILRDEGCDLGCYGYEIYKGIPIYIHHINPINVEDIKNHSPAIFDLNNLITTTFNTHQIIHYQKKKYVQLPIERSKNDTCPWKS